MRVTSDFLSLNWADLGRGLLVAAGSAVVDAFYSSIQAGNVHIDAKQMAIVAGCAAISYLKFKLFTPAQVITTKVD